MLADVDVVVWIAPISDGKKALITTDIQTFDYKLKHLQHPQI